MRVLRLVVPVLVLAAVAVGSAEAQGRRQGFWISGGLGGGVNTAQGLDGERLAGGASYLRLGGALTPQVLLGADIIGWVRSQNDVSNIRGNTTIAALFYPSPNGGFFVKGGVGLSVVRVSADVLGVSVSGTEKGFGSTLGVGVDLPIGRSVSLTPNLDMLLQRFDAGIGSQTNTLLVFTVGITGH